MEADIIIKNGMVLTMDDKFTLHKKADVAVSDSKIISISEKTNHTSKKIIEADGMLVMPGLINCHTHAAMTLLRGLADDMPLDVWWNKFIFPIEKKFVNPEFVRIGCGLAAIEMIKSGTTSFADMYFYEDAAAEICKQIGIRAFLGEGILDFPTPDSKSADEALIKIEKLHEKWGKDPIIHLMVAPHAPYSCSAENLIKSRKLADKLNLPLHIHLAETASEAAEVENLERIGFLCDRLSAAHCVHLSKKDMDILKKRDVKVAHCLESNMKLASGAAPIVEMNDLGITIGLGTDGAASNNNLDMFDEMDAAAKVHKLVRSDPTVMDAKTVLKMATGGAAKVLLKEKEIGSLEVGKKADIIILDLNRPHLTPLYNIYSNLVYSAGGGEVDTAIINGKLIMENRDILTIDEEEIIDRANSIARRIENEIKT